MDSVAFMAYLLYINVKISVRFFVSKQVTNTSHTNQKDTLHRTHQEFINLNFYVDDGLTSLPTSGEAISLMKRIQKALMSEGNLRLHKIASNDPKDISRGVFCTLQLIGFKIHHKHVRSYK